MYELLVEHKTIFMGMGAVAFGLFSIAAIYAARVLQGTMKKTLTSPIYSAYIYVVASAVIATVGEFLIYRADKISMAVGICLFVFAMMVLFATFCLSVAAKCYKKPLPSTLTRRPFDNLFR